jgi:hypothetical protein
MGMEIRGRLVNYVNEKIRAMRIESDGKSFGNIACIRTNAMRHLT